MLAFGIVRRQLRVLRVQLALAIVALSGAGAVMRWAWRRRQAAQPSPAG